VSLGFDVFGLDLKRARRWIRQSAGFDGIGFCSGVQKLLALPDTP
jgi:hypothetical protein